MGAVGVVASSQAARNAVRIMGAAKRRRVRDEVFRIEADTRVLQRDEALGVE
jgi:hypothetical protein